MTFSGGMADDEAAIRTAKWQAAINGGVMPDFLEQRLRDASVRKTPWISTMTPAELLQARRLGIRPITMVSGTCWYHFGYSWTKGHAEGWELAISRMKEEARAAGANAIVDVTMRTIRVPSGDSMDFSVTGTAVKFDELPPSTDPVVATVPAVEFIRLLREGIVPVGVAVGAHYEWFYPYTYNPTGSGSFSSMPLPEMSDFWQGVRWRALYSLKQEARRMGDGVLAHTQFGQLIWIDAKENNNRAGLLGRYIAIGTVVQCKDRDNILAKINTVIDMRDDLSPLDDPRPHGHNAYPTDNEQEGVI
jgi:uncharacterized protein YbjQ (UPF0145 family)